MHTLELSNFVEHRECVQAKGTLEMAIRAFQSHSWDYMAVVDGRTYLGLLSRTHLGMLLGHRFGFSLHARERVVDHQLPETLRADPDWSLLELLDRALARTGPAFHHDIPLVGESGCFLGILTVERLVRAQAQVMSEQMELAERRRRELEEINQQLFEGYEEFRQSEGRYAALFHHNPLGVGILSPAGELEAANTRLGEALGLGHRDFLARVSSGDRQAFMALLKRLDHRRDGSPAQLEPSLDTAEQGTRLFRLHASWIFETSQVCGVFHDITEQRAMERHLALHEKAAMVEHLAGGIARELNNKLAPVLGFAELLALKLEEIASNESLIKYCHAIETSAKEAGRIVRQLLQLGRPPQAEMVPTNLCDIVSEAKSMVSFRLQSNKVTCHMDLPPGGAPVLVDPSQLKQVVVNLMLNAIDAMEHSLHRELRLGIRLEKHIVRLDVSDSGHGIPQENLQSIFDPFYTTKGPDRGTGLGLSVSLSILQQHHGEILVSSRSGEGSCFTVALPRREDLVVAIPGAKRVLEQNPPDRMAKELRALVVDDEPHVAHLIREMLQIQLGCQVSMFHGMQEALDVLQKEPFDLVLTDLRMPGLDGFALLAWAKAHRPEILNKVLVISGDGGGLEAEDLMNTWGVPSLVKPFSVSTLMKACRSLLGEIQDSLVTV